MNERLMFLSPCTRALVAALVDEMADELEAAHKECGGPYGGLEGVGRLPKSKVQAVRRVAQVFRGDRPEYFAMPQPHERKRYNPDNFSVSPF